MLYIFFREKNFFSIEFSYVFVGLALLHKLVVLFWWNMLCVCIYIEGCKKFPLSPLQKNKKLGLDGSSY